MGCGESHYWLLWIVVGAGIGGLTAAIALGEGGLHVEFFERAAELKVLCDPRVRRALLDEGIRLCSFREFTPDPPGQG